MADAQAAHIRVGMVTGDDVTTGAAIALQLGIPGEAILGADFAALKEFRWTLIPPVALLGLSELGKFLARRRTRLPSPT